MCALGPLCLLFHSRPVPSLFGKPVSKIHALRFAWNGRRTDSSPKGGNLFFVDIHESNRVLSTSVGPVQEQACRILRELTVPINWWICIIRVGGGKQEGRSIIVP